MKKLLIILFCFISIPMSSATYYVAKTGRDNNVGSLASPWLTITHAETVAVAGDIVYVRSGVYNEEITIFSHNGTASNPIIFTNYPNERPVIDGQGSLPNGDWGAMVSIESNYVNISGFEIKNVHTNGLNDGGEGLRLIGHHCKASYMNVHHIWDHGIIALGDYSIVEYCEVWQCAYSNSLNPGEFGWGTGLSACRDLVNGVTDYAILRHNIVHDNWGEGLSCFETTHTTMEDNIVYDNWSVNLYVSDSQDALVQRNLVYQTHLLPAGVQESSPVGIFLGDERSVPPSMRNKIINNLVYGTERCFGSEKMDNVLVANNTFVNSTYNSCVQIFDWIHVNSFFINNIVIQEGNLPCVTAGTKYGLTYSHNLYNKTYDSDVVGVGDIISTNSIVKVGTYSDVGYYDLSPTSPAINGGSNIGVGSDYRGVVRDIPDIGALEYITSIIKKKVTLFNKTVVQGNKTIMK